MEFKELYCNGMQNPLGIGTQVILNWNYKSCGERGIQQKAFQVLIVDESKSIVIDTGKIQSDDMKYAVLENCKLQPGNKYFWTITAWIKNERIISEQQYFEIAIDDLDKALWIECGNKEEVSAPIFSKKFICNNVAKCRAYVSGLGLIHCQINGSDCSDAMLMPPNTKYEYYSYFETFDLTDKLHHGENVFTVQLGNGYNAEFSKWGYRYLTPRGMRASIIITHEDGSYKRIDSDESWMWQDSSITINGLYFGEEYDARKKDNMFFSAVAVQEHSPNGKLIPNEMPKIRVRQIQLPIAYWETDEGTVYDFGINSQGIAEIEVEAQEGCVISLQYSELINPDGTIDLFTNRNARAKDVYICNGNGVEKYKPKFTYHGFRYILVNTSKDIQSFKIKALYISADVKKCGDFSSSEPIINRIYSICTNSMLSNFVSIPTDCPVRDERTPCLMDSLMYGDAAMYNFNMYSFYLKWLRDISTDKDKHNNRNMDWEGDIIMLPYRIYLFYGDMIPAKTVYPLMKKTMQYWMDNSEEGIWTKGFGDWCLPNQNVWESFFGYPYAANTSLFYTYTWIMKQFAEIFGEYADIQLFESMGEKIRDSFINKFWHEDGTVGGGNQSEMLLPLFYGILTDEIANKTKAALISKIKEDGFFDVGGYGVRTIIPVMAASNKLDLFMDIIRDNSYPGFGYWVAMGATSTWEQWAQKGIMHSHNHALHTGISATLHQVFCGISPTSPSFKTFLIAPSIPKQMNYVKGSLDTYSGKIEVRVERFNDCLTLSCVIPPNTQATLRFPEYENYKETILFDGERQIENKAELTLGSGIYCFRFVPKKYVEFNPHDN